MNYLFVYSSLRTGFHNHSHQYISQYFKLVGNGRVQGILFDKGDYPVAKPTAEEKYITGELYAIKDEMEADYAFAQLDDYEGLVVEIGETPLYKREQVTVFCNNLPYSSWIYWYNGPVAGLPQIESGDVMEYWKNKK